MALALGALSADYAPRLSNHPRHHLWQFIAIRELQSISYQISETSCKMPYWVISYGNMLTADSCTYRTLPPLTSERSLRQYH